LSLIAVLNPVVYKTETCFSIQVKNEGELYQSPGIFDDDILKLPAEYGALTLQSR